MGNRIEQHLKKWGIFENHKIRKAIVYLCILNIFIQLIHLRQPDQYLLKQDD